MRNQPDIDKKQQKFLLVLIGTSVTLWNIFFELGAWGQIFYEHFFYIWILSLALSISVFLFPSAVSRLQPLQKLASIFPSFWLGVSILIVAYFSQSRWAELLVFFGLIASIFCLPFLFHVLLLLFEPDSVGFSTTDTLKLAVVITVVSSSGFMTGKFNHVFMTCADFVVAGSSAPPTCEQESALDSVFTKTSWEEKESP